MLRLDIEDFKRAVERVFGSIAHPASLLEGFTLYIK